MQVAWTLLLPCIKRMVSNILKPKGQLDIREAVVVVVGKDVDPWIITCKVILLDSKYPVERPNVSTLRNFTIES